MDMFDKIMYGFFMILSLVAVFINLETGIMISMTVGVLLAFDLRHHLLPSKETNGNAETL